MKRRNDGGFIHIIACILILIIFGITIYACLDILDLIDVPEEYSINRLLSKFSKEVVIENNYSEENKVENIDKKIEIERENKIQESYTNIVAPQINGYDTNTNNNTLKESSNTYYYDQLDEYAKIIYTELEKNLDNMKTGEYNVDFGKTFNELLHEETGEETLNKSFQLAINALNFDHSDLFYLNISNIYLLTRATTQLWTTTYTVQIGSNEGQNYLNPSFKTREDVEIAIANLKREKEYINSIVGGTDENKIRIVHDYLVNKLEYDSTLSRNNIYNLYGALINRCTVCEGYARAFKYIMDSLDIPCIIACGTGINNSGEIESHAWNYVMLNEKWYAIDVTWDDPIIIGNGYLREESKYKYYLKGSNEFFSNHTEDGNVVGDANFKYPTLSATNY